MSSILDEFTELAEQLGAELEQGTRDPGFWELFAQGIAVRALVFAPEPRPLRAYHLVEALLEREPRLHLARTFLQPFVTERTPLAREDWRALKWTTVAEETEPDAALPGLADATQVALCSRDGSLWVRVTLTEAPNRKLFGVNLVVDSDASQATGLPWWGGGTGFTFDRLVSAWVALDEDGNYRGAVGVAAAGPAFAGEMTGLEGQRVRFGIDDEQRALVLRVPLEKTRRRSALHRGRWFECPME